MSSGISTNYQYNGYSSYQPNMLDSKSWEEKANQQAENIKNNTTNKTSGTGSTSKSSGTSSTSGTSSSGAINVGSSASTSTFLLAYQSQLEDLEASAAKLQMSGKDNVFSKYDEAVKKAQENPSEDNTKAVDKALDNIVSAFKDLTNKYNNVMSFLSNNQERGSGIAAQMESFKRMMPHEKTMSAMGMGYDTNGKVTFDEDAFRENWEKDPNQIKNLTGGQFGFAERLGSKATSILDSSVDKIIGGNGSTSAISTSDTGSSSASGSSTTSSLTKSSTMSDSFMQFANFARSGAYNLSNYYTVSMLNMLV